MLTVSLLLTAWLVGLVAGIAVGDRLVRLSVKGKAVAGGE